MRWHIYSLVLSCNRVKSCKLMLQIILKNIEFLRKHKIVYNNEDKNYTRNSWINFIPIFKSVYFLLLKLNSIDWLHFFKQFYNAKIK